MTRIKQGLAMSAGVLAAMVALGLGAVIIAASLVVGAIMLLSARLALSARPKAHDGKRERTEPTEVVVTNPAV